MAYEFVSASNQYISGNASPLGTGQLGNHTIAVWNNSNGTALFSISRSSETSGINNPTILINCTHPANGNYGLRANSSPSGEFWNGGVGSALAATSDAFVSGTWKHICCTLSETTSTFYVDGVASGTNNSGGSVPTTTGLDRIGIGALVRGNASGAFDGSAAEVAVWNVALTASEAASLGKGFSPRRVRPQSLVFYAPLIRNLQDLDNALALTNNNTATVAAHPRVI